MSYGDVVIEIFEGFYFVGDFVDCLFVVMENIEK